MIHSRQLWVKKKKSSAPLKNKPRLQDPKELLTSESNNNSLTVLRIRAAHTAKRWGIPVTYAKGWFWSYATACCLSAYTSPAQEAPSTLFKCEFTVTDRPVYWHHHCYRHGSCTGTVWKDGNSGLQTSETWQIVTAATSLVWCITRYWALVFTPWPRDTQINTMSSNLMV